MDGDERSGGAGVDERLEAGARGDGARWRGRLINFFAFFDPHKLCRYTTEGSPRALKGSAPFCERRR